MLPGVTIGSNTIIGAGSVVNKNIPDGVIAILAWCVIHQDELMQNWELSKDGLPLNKINPLV